MTTIDLGGPTDGDVLDLILEDHRRFEGLLRDLRNADSDRDKVRAAFSTLHVAHAEAEERYVYPALRKQHAVTEHDADLGAKFAAERNRQIDHDCGRIANVRRIVREAEAAGRLD